MDDDDDAMQQRETTVREQKPTKLHLLLVWTNDDVDYRVQNDRKVYTLKDPTLTWYQRNDDVHMTMV